MSAPPKLRLVRGALALLATLALCLGIMLNDRGSVRAGAKQDGGSKASKEKKDKLSADLRKKVREAKADDEIDVIIQTTNGVVLGESFETLDVSTAKVKARKVEALASRSDVAYVSLDREVKQLGHVSLTAGADAAAAQGGATPYDGAGIGIVVMDSGIDPNHVSFKEGAVSRIVYSKDFTGENRTDDPYGHGTHVAALAAGNDFVSSGAYKGVASGAKIINLRVLNAQGRGTTSQLLAALDWVLANRNNTTYSMKVVNLSLGTAAVDSYEFDPLCLAARRLVDAGIVVAAAAGNEGKDGAGNKIYGQIHSPGNDPSVITVGASNTFGTDARSDDGVTSYSSRGPTRSFWTDALGVKHYDNLIKPDLVAPGNKLIAAQAPANRLVTDNPALDADVSANPTKEQMYMSGTSMATPVVAGAAALLMQANPTLTPNLVKALLMYTAQPLAGFNNFEQGAGQVNLDGAMRLARLVRTDLSATTAVGAPLLTSALPAATTTIAGQTFQWGQGIILDHTFATGTSLVTEYQKVYGLGVLLADMTIEAGGVLLADGTLVSHGVTLSEGVLISDGTTLGAGTYFSSTGVLMSDGALMADGAMMSDGGKVVGDGAMMSDGVMMADVALMAVQAMLGGDNTGFMAVRLDGEPGTLAVTPLAQRGQLKLSWVDRADNEYGFHIERSTNGVNFTQIATVGANAKTYQNVGLANNTRYYYRVYAYGAKGTSAYSNVASATTRK